VTLAQRPAEVILAGRPERYRPWGQPTRPLLWSHAKFLRLQHALRDRR
jgi:hypothetical protein